MSSGFERDLGEFANSIQQLERDELVGMLRNLRCGFELDFTDDYLTCLSTERLRHIVLAAAMHSIPETKA